MATNDAQQGNNALLMQLPLGDYNVVVDGHTFAMRLIHRATNRHDQLTLQVISSSKWFRKTGRRWSGFAFYFPNLNHRVTVWAKFRGTRKRNRDWDKLAQAFRTQVLRPYLRGEQ